MEEERKEEDIPRAKPGMKRVNKSLGAEVELIDLDVTPVMNLFMVLIPFLVSMAVFTHLAVIDFSLPPSQAPAQMLQDGQQEEIDLSVVISNSGFRIVGSGKKLDPVPKVDNEYQFEQFRRLLKSVKFQYPGQKSVILVLEPDILYSDIITFMDVCRESQFPDIGLSGDIG